MIIGQNPYINRIQNNKNAGFKQLKLKQSKEAWNAIDKYGDSFHKWSTLYLNRTVPEKAVKEIASHAKKNNHRWAKVLEEIVNIRYPKK
jgi:hypothetical protein